MQYYKDVIFCCALIGTLFVSSASSFYHYKRLATEKNKNVRGNDCKESEPWPCKSGKCLSFDFVCDGFADCPDKYDEDPQLCTAMNRPAEVVVEGFIDRFRDWLIPTFLGQEDVDVAAKALIESKTLDDFAKTVGLSEDQKQSFGQLLTDFKRGRQIKLVLDGMPEDAWKEGYVIFSRIVKSGFLGDTDDLR